MAELNIINGKVKFFSKEKGYGFIYSNDGNNYYFHIKDVKGPDQPCVGDILAFTTIETEKGLRAKNIEIRFKKESVEKVDDRVICGVCGRRMVPRLIFYKGEIDKSVCPFCHSTYKRHEPVSLGFFEDFLGNIGFVIFFAVVIVFLYMFFR